MSHFYTDEGKLIEGDIRKARKHNLLPSVTTVLYVIAKEWGLQNWVLEEHIKEAVGISRKRFGSEGDFVLKDSEIIKQVKEAQNAKRDTIMEYGNVIHNLMERIVKGERMFHIADYEDRIKNTIPAMIEWAYDNQVNVIDTEKVMVNTEHGFASTFDLHCKIGSEEWLIDYKTQGTKEGKPVTRYKEWSYQLGGYDILLDGKPKRYGNLVISSTEPGRIEMKEWKQEEIDHGRDIFLTALKLYKLIKKL